MKKRKLSAILLSTLGLAIVVLFSITATSAKDVSKMTKEELKDLVGRSDVIIIDVRIGKHWKNSKSKIKGAVKEDPMDFDSWANKYRKDKILVLYCS